MSLIDAPQRLVSRLIGRTEQAVKPDDPIARMITRTSGRLRPEPTYRWRLRGRVVNQFVAVREGLVLEASPRASMGALSRAVLYASLGLAISVTAVAASSSGALPGDPLFAVKRQVEELRMEISPPSVRPMLAAMALEERLSEVELLAASGEWARAALGEQEVQAAVETLERIGGTVPSGELAQLAQHAQVLTDLLVKAPASARSGLERALVASTAAATGLNPGLHNGQENHLGGGAAGTTPNQTNGENQAGKGKSAGGAAASSAAQPSPTVVPSPKPTHAPNPPTPHATPLPSTQPSTRESSQDTKVSGQPH